MGESEPTFHQPGWSSAQSENRFLTSFQAAALVQIYTDGSVLVAHGGAELGQGINTKMIQVRGVVSGIAVERT